MTRGVEATTGGGDLADHFIACCGLGRHLTLPDEKRYVISDDFRTGRLNEPVSTTFASIYANDALVAQAAVFPLCRTANGLPMSKAAKFEELFDLIERTALSGEVRYTAKTLLDSGFSQARLKAAEADLASKLTPARKRYRVFLEAVRQLMERKVSVGVFQDEFLEFTRVVAGRLDFGIYSFCLDRIFLNRLIDLEVKQFLVEEIAKYPSLICKELLSNLMAAPGQDRELVRFATQVAIRNLSRKSLTDIYLLTSLKVSHHTSEESDRQLMRSIDAQVRNHSGVILS